LHVFLPKARFSGILFTWAAYRTSKLALAIAFNTKAVRRQQNPSSRATFLVHAHSAKHKVLLLNDLRKVAGWLFVSAF
jgi:hypothetical protein